ncbi:MAG: hypothetical protein AAFR16_05215 [Pseudomonadota bacterium]
MRHQLTADRGARAARWGAAALGLALLGAILGCAEAARPTAVVVQATDATLAAPGELLHRAVSVGAVLGGEATTMLSKSKMSNADFREGLTTSLKLSDLLADDPSASRYILDTTIEGVAQPNLQVNFTVTSTIYYRLRGRDGRIHYDQRITHAATAKIGDSIVREERIRLATEASVRENLERFLKQVTERSRAEPYDFI